MKIKEPLIILATFLVLFNSCNKKSEKSIPVLDLESAVSTPSEIKCSDFIESFEYIPLETSENCLVGTSPTVQIVGENIVVQTINDCLIFDRNEGRFKYRIARQGRGPGEYQRTMRLVDPVNETVFFRRSGGDILEYSLQNELVNEFQIPTYDGSLETPSLPTDFIVYKNWLLCYFTNLIGDEKKLIMAINKNTGKPDFIIPNKHVFERKPLSIISTNELSFYTFNNQLFFKEDYNDTVFSLQDSVLAPHLIISTGKYHFAYDKKWDRSVDKSVFITPRNIMESNQYLYFEYYQNKEPYNGLYSKENDKLVVATNAEGIPNDVDDFVNFSPKSYNSDDIWLGITDAWNITDWFEQNPEKAAKLPPRLQKLKNIKENDNPVIVIAKLKE